MQILTFPSEIQFPVIHNLAENKLFCSQVSSLAHMVFDESQLK